jgi:hypothetical protein
MGTAASDAWTTPRDRRPPAAAELARFESPGLIAEHALTSASATPRRNVTVLSPH